MNHPALLVFATNLSIPFRIQPDSTLCDVVLQCFAVLCTFNSFPDSTSLKVPYDASGNTLFQFLSGFNIAKRLQGEGGEERLLIPFRIQHVYLRVPEVARIILSIPFRIQLGPFAR